MSHADHEWAREQIQAHLAGGLPADERARLEAHIALCAECIAEIDASRRFERSMDDLFAPVRPKPGLEERVIRSLRTRPVRRPLPAVGRVVLGVAAVALLGVVGLVIVAHETGEFTVLEGLATREARLSPNGVGWESSEAQGASPGHGGRY